VYRVRKFSPTNFFKALATAECPISLVKADRQAQYLFAYLNNDDVRAATIVIEPDYVDREYLEDYAAFYVSCFYPYDRFCTRVHFFKESITTRRFWSIIRGDISPDSLKRLQNSYLGFIVVRPLPDAMIGRTQLATYGDDGKRRNYTAIRKYHVNLAGIALSVDSMAFQEQDSAVAACATVALWSCFQKTADLFGTPAPRPPVITAAATSSLSTRRALPTSGLIVLQVCEAIRANGLDPEVFPRSAITPSLIYGYLRFGIPLLMIVEIEGYSQQHAVTLNGYSMVREPIGEELRYKRTPENSTGLSRAPLAGRRVNELYAHDDQVGPFSRLLITMPTRPGTPFTMLGKGEAAWEVPDAEPARLAKITPVQIIAPLYRKMRLSFIDARSAIGFILLFARRALERFKFKRDEWEWDIYLTDTNAYKRDVRKNAYLSQARRDYLLTKSQPKYFWRCILRVLRTDVMEVCVDATEFTKSNPVFLVNHFYGEFAKAFAAQVNVTAPGPRIHPKFRDVLLREHKQVISAHARGAE
jgi:hypothetical protein